MFGLRVGDVTQSFQDPAVQIVPVPRRQVLYEGANDLVTSRLVQP